MLNCFKQIPVLPCARLVILLNGTFRRSVSLVNHDSAIVTTGTLDVHRCFEISEPSSGGFGISESQDVN